MEKKQTAVDWLESQINLGLSERGLISAFKQAKQMEKEQIMDAWDMGLCVQDMNDICSEYYYNDTFKGGRG
jgi:hypothetical protein